MNNDVFIQKYNKHNFLFRDYQQAFEKAKINVRFPIARDILFNLIDRMDAIYRGMLDMASQDNIYSSYIQYRALIDHFIKIQYIVDKTATELSDATAEQYQKHYLIWEVLGEQGGVLQMEDILNDTPASTDFITFLTTKFPELSGFDKDNQREISATIKQFGLAAMVKHLTNRYRQLPNNPYGGILAQTLPEFAQISSFTHGGPYAGQILLSLMRDKKAESQLEKQLHIGLTMLGSSKENSLLVYEIDKSSITILEELQGLRTIPVVSSEDSRDVG